jgi:hypothetical protein
MRNIKTLALAPAAARGAWSADPQIAVAAGEKGHLR